MPTQEGKGRVSDLEVESRDTAAFCSMPGWRPEGLGSAEASARLRQYGPNTIEHRRQEGTLALVAAQFSNPMMLMLILAAAISFPVGAVEDGLVILGIILLSGLISFWQERDASRAVAALRALVAIRARVLRDGVETEVKIEEIVPGDVALLSAGAMVPADGLLLEANGLHVDEAALTGEGFPVEKRVEPLVPDAPLSTRRGEVFLGTHVVSGAARVLVLRTGRATIFGGISRSVAAPRAPTGFEHEVQRFGMMLLRVAIALVVGVFAINTALERPLLESFLFSMALAVGLVPELLPVIVGVTLARGARGMADHGVVVKHLPSIENFGSMDVLCSDKTGTLTQGRIRLESALNVSGAPSEAVLLYAQVNATFESGYQNPIDAAIRSARSFDPAPWRLLGELPYDFSRRRLSVAVQGPEGPRLVTKGAFHSVLEICTTARTPTGQDAPIDAIREELEARYASLSEAGLRVLGLAVRPLPEARPPIQDDEAGLCFLGLLAFADPVREDAQAAVERLRSLGIRLVVITGDGAAIAGRITREVMTAAQVVVRTGAELQELGDAALVRLVRETDVFAEVEPGQKARIVRALRSAGHVVGYLGDGINDAPALHAADVGISVDGATDVAREAAQVVMMRRDLGVLVEGVRQGRRTFANTLKYISISVSANFGNMVSMAVGVPFLPFLPLLPKQILLNNFLSDIPVLAIASDRVDEHEMEVPQRWDMRQIRWFMLVFGGISSIFDLMTFTVLLALPGASEARFHTGWFVESLLTELLVLLVLRSPRSLLASRPSTMLLALTALVGMLACLLPFLPWRVLDVVPLPPVYWGVLALLVLGYLAATEVAKVSFYRRFERNARRGAR